MTDFRLSLASLIVLALTFGAIAWYSFETRRLRQETARLRRETHRQTQLQIQPFVALHWPGTAPVVGLEVQEWTLVRGAFSGYRLAGLCVENVGARPALAVEISDIPVSVANPKGWAALRFVPFDYLVPGKPAEVRVEATGHEPATEVEQPPLNTLYRETLDEIGCSDGVEIQVGYRDLVGNQYRLVYLVHRKGVFLKQPAWTDADP